MTAQREGQQVDTLPNQMYGWDGEKPVKIRASFTGDINSSAPTIESINDAIQRLTFLCGVKGIASDIRVTLLSGTVTTVSTLNNVTNLGGHPATLFMNASQNTAYALSNLQNVGVN